MVIEAIVAYYGPASAHRRYPFVLSGKRARHLAETLPGTLIPQGEHHPGTRLSGYHLYPVLRARLVEGAVAGYGCVLATFDPVQRAPAPREGGDLYTYTRVRDGRVLEIVGVAWARPGEKCGGECLPCASARYCLEPQSFAQRVQQAIAGDVDVWIDERAPDAQGRCVSCGYVLARLVRGWMRQLPFRDPEAFEAGSGTCYIPKNDAERWHRQDLLALVGGDEQRLTRLFERCVWLSPRTIVDLAITGLVEAYWRERAGEARTQADRVE